MGKFLIRSLIVISVGALTLSRVWAQADWPQFRGRDAGVAADDPRLPIVWSTTENVVWKTEIPGVGWSSPVVSGDHVFVTAVVSAAQEPAAKRGLYLDAAFVTEVSRAVHRWVVYDVDLRSGRIRWQRDVRQAPPTGPKHSKNSYASATPVTDGERVYVYFADVGLFAFDMEGKPVWSRELGPTKTRNGWGSGTSPVVHRGRVYLVCDHDGQSFLAAFDARGGKELWRINRDEGTNWSSPFIWEHEQRTEIVTSGSDKVRAYDLNGRLLWEFAGMSEISIPTPFARHGLLYISSGYIADRLRPTYAIKPGASGDISLRAGETSNSFVAWSHPTIAPYHPSPLVYGDYLYTLHDRGFFTVHNAKTGQEVYGRQRIGVDASGFTSSPWAYNGKIFVLSEDGDTYVLEPGPAFKVLGKNSMGEMTLATPAVADGNLILRTASRLFRISEARASGTLARSN